MEISDRHLKLSWSSVESWKYQFEVVIIRIYKSTGIDEFIYGKGRSKEEPRAHSVKP